MLFPEFSISPSGSQIWPISYRYIIQPISYSKLSTLVLRIFQTSLLEKTDQVIGFCELDLSHIIWSIRYGQHPYHRVSREYQVEFTKSDEVISFFKREVLKILKTKVESYLYDMGHIQNPDGEIENSGKNIFEIQIPNFCYIQVIVFNTFYIFTIFSWQRTC